MTDDELIAVEAYIGLHNRNVTPSESDVRWWVVVVGFGG